MNDIDLLIDVYLLGCTGFVPTTIFAILDIIFEFEFDTALVLMVILIIWYLLLSLIWFKK